MGVCDHLEGVPCERGEAKKDCNEVTHRVLRSCDGKPSHR